MANADSYVRAVEVHRMLKNGEMVNSTILSERFELSTRHAQRIIDFLLDKLKAPLEYDSRRRTYVYREPTFELPTRIMSEGEAVALLVAHQALVTQQATPLGSRLMRALDTLKDLLPETVSVGASDLLENVSFEPSPGRRVDGHVLELLVTAVERRQTVRTEYYAAHTDTTTTRDIDIYHVTHRRGDWYAIGFCHLRGALRTFALSRMRAVVLTDRRYEMSPDFNAATYFSESLGVDASGTPTEVVLEFDAQEARYISERTWHASQRIEPLPGGGLRLHLAVRVGAELVSWIMSSGPHVRVVTPPALAADVARLHREAAARYDV